MRLKQVLFHTTCDACGTKEPVKFRTIPVAGAQDMMVICTPCLVILAGIDPEVFWNIAENAGRMQETRLAKQAWESDDPDYDGFVYTSDECLKDMGSLIKRLKFREPEDARE